MASRRKSRTVAKRRSWLPVAATVVVVAALVGTFVLLRMAATPAPQPPAGPDTAAQVLASITSIPAAELDQVGLGSVTGSLTPVTGSTRTATDGKPIVLYVGAEYCPYCAAERWPMIIALSRFGSFSGLRTTVSSSQDVYPNTATFTFHGSGYTSAYLHFEAVELFGNQADAQDNYPSLDQLTSEQQAIVNRYNAPPYTSPAGGIPFIDFANRFVFSGSTYQPDVIQGQSWQQVADARRQPSSPQARAILGSANLITAGICQLTGQQPNQVCSLPSIRSIEASHLS